MCFALNMMKRIISKCDNIEKLSELYDEVRREFSVYNSEVQKGKHCGFKNYMYGKHHSIEARKRISEANKGRKISEETRKKLSEANKGRKISEITKQRMKKPKSETTKLNMRKPKSETHKLHISQSRKGLKWITNGNIEKTILIGEKIPSGFRFGRCCNKCGKRKT